MKLTDVTRRIRTNIQHLGLLKTAYEMLIVAINLVVTFRVIRVFKVEKVDPKFLESDDPLQWGFFDEAQLLRFAENPENKMAEDFVRNALERGDACYGACDGDTLAACGWYSNMPTDDEGLDIHFSPEYIYMYAGFTHPKYRGKRLHAIGMTRALREYLDRGHKGLISFAASHNFRSLQSAYRMGYQYVGTVVALKLGSRLLTRATRGCREHGFYIAMPRPTPVPSEPVLTA